jgi:hypothetical protein
MKASDFDRKFDEGKDITAELDLSTLRRPAQEQRRVNVDLPWVDDRSPRP